MTETCRPKPAAAGGTTVRLISSVLSCVPRTSLLPLRCSYLLQAAFSEQPSYWLALVSLTLVPRQPAALPQSEPLPVVRCTRHGPLLRKVGDRPGFHFRTRKGNPFLTCFQKAWFASSEVRIKGHDWYSQTATPDVVKGLASEYIASRYAK